MGKLRYALLIGVLILGVLCNGCILSGREDGRPHNGYYDYVELSPDGTVVCRGKLTDQEAKNGRVCFKVEMDDKNKDRLKRISAVINDEPLDVDWIHKFHSSAGFFASMEISEDDGYLNYTFKNAEGNACYGLYGAATIRYQLGENGQCIRAYLYDCDDNNSSGYLCENDSAKLSQLLFEHDSKGRLVKINHTDVNGKPVVPVEIGHEVKLTYDDKNPDFLEQIEYVGANDISSKRPKGYDIKKFVHDEKGRITEVQHLNVNSELVAVKVEKDKYQPKIKAEYNLRSWDIASHPHSVIMLADYLRWLNTACIELGTITKYVYDEDGFAPIEISAYGKDGETVGNKWLEGAASLKMSRDANNNIIELAPFAIDGMPMTYNEAKVSAWRFVYDKQGRIIEISTYDAQGNLIVDGQTAKTRIDYDDNGRVDALSYFGIDDSPSAHKYQDVYDVYKVRFEYNKDKYGAERYKFYDKNGNELTPKPYMLLGTYWK